MNIAVLTPYGSHDSESKCFPNIFFCLLQYKLPLPKGGKHAVNPRLVADQPEAQNRIGNRSRAKMNVFDPDYVANSSPFSLTDVTSKAAQLGIRSQKGHTHNWERRNPNVVRKNRRK